MAFAYGAITRFGDPFQNLLLTMAICNFIKQVAARLPHRPGFFKTLVHDRLSSHNSNMNIRLPAIRSSLARVGSMQ